MENKYPSVIALIAVLAVGFSLGLFYEQSRTPDAAAIINLPLTNRDEGMPDGVDFSLFWDAWNVIQERHVDASAFDTQELVYSAIDGLLAGTGDPYTVFFRKEEGKRFEEDIRGEFAGVGIEIGLRDNQLTIISPIEGTPGFNAGLAAGDRIVSVDGNSTAGINVQEAVSQIRGKRNTEVVLGVFRDGFTEPKDFPIKRDTIKIPALKWSFLDTNEHDIIGDKKIAHIRVLTFSQNVDSEFKEAANEIVRQGADGIILDVRNNPGGLLDSSVNLASYFLEPGLTVLTEQFGNGTSNTFPSRNNAQLEKLPLVILVNQGSASASEILAGAIRDNRDVSIIGMTTYGKGSVQEIQELPKDTTLKVTIAKWLTPSGVTIDDTGITPDIEVDRTREEFDDGLDPQLDTAIEEVIKQI